MKGPPLFLLSETPSTFLMCRGEGASSLFLSASPSLAVSVPLIRVFHMRSGKAYAGLPPIRSGVQKKPFPTSCVNNLQERPVPNLSRSSAIQSETAMSCDTGKALGLMGRAFSPLSLQPFSFKSSRLR